jgi:acetyl esterase
MSALDPQARALIDLAIKAGRPAYHTLSPKDARQLFRDTRAAVVPVPPAIGAVRDVATDGGLPLRVYRPAGVPDSTRLPAVVFFHGGGWVIGEVETYDVLCRQLTAATGASVISVDYRLAPEHKFPAAAEDAFAATRWIAGHAAELGLDGARLAVAGDSAGGNLAAVVALMARDAGGPAIGLQVLVYPVTDVMRETRTYADFAEGYLLTRDSMRWFIAHYLRSKDDARDWRVSPVRAASLAGLPPALVITAGFDPLRDEGEMYANRLRDAGVRVDYVCFGGMVHGFIASGKLLDTAGQAVALVGHAVRQALR